MLFLVFALSCKKTTSNPSNSTNGTYKGLVSIYLNTLIYPDSILKGNGPLFGTVNDIAFTVSGSSKYLTLHTDLIISSTATLSANVFTISKHTVTTTSISYTVEYGTGTFVNNKLLIDLHQDQILNAGNIIVVTGTWIGTLTKQ
jgi:hypothetical protein